ncbi:cytochrome P450 [Nonomuraea sp. NPDC049400]|uniref:cytochrome P450 n=1 Tax=Nonomuraea sp. NPDC049400 TaxID=3364352 RepID=UPI0037BBD475
MTLPHPAPALPTERTTERPFDPPAGLAQLREERPLSRLSYPDGHVGWLVTSHALCRQVLADLRFSARLELQHLPIPGLVKADRPAPPGAFAMMDPPEHTRYRRVLTGEFTVRRMRLLTERIQEITAERLDAMEETGPPVDLVKTWAQPIPAQLTCELLGVPYADRARFEGDALALFRLDSSLEERGAAIAALRVFIGELVREKRANPTDDLLSGLTTSDLTDEELVNIGVTVLAGGMDTTANLLAMGTYALLRNPEQLAALRADPRSTVRAVEELLRYLSVAPFLTRTALEDVELEGELIKAGETVTVSIAAANRDPKHFADPDTLDVLRSSGGHVTFGHGIHQCIGQQLARVELQVALPVLVSRFPTLRLAVSPADLALRTDMTVYGVHQLPVTWDA